MQNENCFVYYKLDYICKECSQKVLKINALNDENNFNYSDFNFNFNLKN